MRINQKFVSLIDDKELFDKVKFRTKFEVTLAEWNPRTNLIALGSRDGDVVVKRYLWKTGWKRNFSREQPFQQFRTIVDDPVHGTSSNNTVIPSVLNLTWSPDGQLLLAALQGGHCYYLDTQTGNPLYYKKLSYSPTIINWLRVKNGHKGMDFTYPCAAELCFKMISAEDLNVYKDHVNVCKNVENFYQKFLNNSLISTFLFILCSSNVAFIEIFANGVSLIRRINFGMELTNNITAHSQNLQALRSKFLFKGRRLQLSIRTENSSTTLQFSENFTQHRLRIYNQLVDCIGLMSFCCLYLQEMYHYSTRNWQQSSEAFHQRIFAVVGNNTDQRPSTDSTYPFTLTQNDPKPKNGPLGLCRDLLDILEERGEVSELIEVFLSSSITQKELKQASAFVEEFTILINAISCGMQLASNTLKTTIILFRSLLTKLAENQLYDGGNMGMGPMDPADQLLDTLLKIASDHAKFEQNVNLSKNLQQILSDFEHSIILLEMKLQFILDLAELNQNELRNLLRWFVVLLYESRGNWTKNINGNIDVKLLSTFLSEITSNNGVSEDDEKYVLDRVGSQLGCNNDGTGTKTINRNEMEIDLDTTPNNTTLGDTIQLCLQHFRILNKEGINLNGQSPINHDKYIILSPADGDEWETESNQTDEDEEGEQEEEEIDEEMSGEKGEGNGRTESARRRRRRTKHPFSLNSFIFGDPGPAAGNEAKG